MCSSMPIEHLPKSHLKYTKQIPKRAKKKYLFVIVNFSFSQSGVSYEKELPESADMKPSKGLPCPLEAFYVFVFN